ncbi:MAG: alpha-amylase [Elusimicrobia bacterium GWA2_69_24]|nr:MAG: alpha-amylase [Elusimicrobia bacterium GWA2_69_24]
MGLKVLAPTPGAKAASAAGSVMLQGFHWESHQASPWWGVIASKAPDIGYSGFDLIWLPPSSAAMSDEGYLPNRWFVVDSKYGTAQQLKSAISALRSNGTAALADLVLNHRVGTKDWGDFTDPAWGPETVCKDDEWPQARGGRDTGMGYHAARDIDHNNPQVQRDVRTWMSWLKSELGYSGWRYDFARGFGTDILAGYDAAAGSAFSVVEVWDNLDTSNPDPHRQALADYIAATGGRVSAFDFTTKGVLQHAVGAGEYQRLRDSSGRPPGLVGWWPAKAVTFLDNHDTGASTGGSGQNLWPFPGDRVMEGYAYILTHPGVPCVYWPHFFDWGLHDPIRDLIWLRKNAGITATSSVAIQTAEYGRYAAVIDGKLAMKIGWLDWSPGPGWTLRAYGKNYAVWTR